jgi:integrase
MPVERLTQERVEKAKAGELLCDDRVTGLMLISQKRVKTWVAQREVKDPETGIRKTARVKLGHFPEVTVQEARDLAKEELRKMEKGRNPHQAKQPGLTLRKAADDFIAGAVTLRPRTLEGYRHTVEHYFKYEREDGTVVDLRDVSLVELGNKPVLVKNLYVWLTKSLRVKGRETTGSKSMAIASMRVLSKVYNTARELNPDLPPNPVRKGVIGKLHKLPSRRVRIPEDGFTAWAEALQTMGNPIRRAFRLFILLTGQRDEATRVMKWEDVDLRPGKEKVHIPEPKGGPEAAFDLPLSPPLVEILKFVRIFSEAEWAYPGSEWVWPTTSMKGEVTCLQESKEQRRKALLSVHPLRRTFISEGYEVAPNKYVSHIVNHACKENVTDDHYFAPSQESVRRALVNIDNALIEKLGGDLAKLLGPQEFTKTQFQSVAVEK